MFEHNELAALRQGILEVERYAFRKVIQHRIAADIAKRQDQDPNRIFDMGRCNVCQRGP